jgi:xylan 1,4-beta-xylosidase
MPASFAGTLNGRSSALPHFWEHTIGSGHATLALRADWQAQMKRAHDELGIRHVRFHGILSDDMGTLICQDDKFLYSFFNTDQIFDFLLSIGMRPFVELSFMPTALSSGGQTVFHYRANVTLPKDYAQWAELIGRLVKHWCDRYGVDEVRQWYFEVWNEPNLTAFGTGQQRDYFELYRYTAQTIKGVDGALRVGGPATADNAWVDDFIAFCRSNGLPADFISTHHYPTDAFGKPGDDTVTQLSESTPSALREEAREVRRQAGNLPVYYTEWSTSSNPRDALHDEPYAAAFIVKTVLEASGLVEGYSYWTFSDIFEENYFPSVPFHGGFGLLNIHGIAKPAYRAYQLLHGLGNELLEVTGSHDTLSAWLVRGGAGTARVVLTNFALPRHSIAAEAVHFTLQGAKSVARAAIRRIDSEHGNAKALWVKMGEPPYLSARELSELDAASRLRSDAQPIRVQNGTVNIDVIMPPLSVAVIELA